MPTHPLLVLQANGSLIDPLGLAVPDFAWASPFVEDPTLPVLRVTVAGDIAGSFAASPFAACAHTASEKEPLFVIGRDS